VIQYSSVIAGYSFHQFFEVKIDEGRPTALANSGKIRQKSTNKNARILISYPDVVLLRLV